MTALLESNLVYSPKIRCLHFSDRFSGFAQQDTIIVAAAAEVALLVEVVSILDTGVRLVVAVGRTPSPADRTMSKP